MQFCLEYHLSKGGMAMYDMYGMYNPSHTPQNHHSVANPFGIVGNQELLQRLERDIKEGHLSHAYIIDGKAGSGRHTLAFHIASALACHNRPHTGEWRDNDPDQISFDLFDTPISQPDSLAPLPCGICEGCRKVREMICPDVHIINRGGKASLGVDAVRHLRGDVHLAPGDMDTKLYIIEDAEAMTPQAQNALLLTLEEPPPYVLFLLLCDGADKLLETIRSRAPILHTQPISHEDMTAYLKKQKISLSQDELDMVLQTADGCIGQALKLSDAKSRKALFKQRELAEAFVSGCATKQPEAALSALYAFGSKRDNVSELLSLVTLALRDLLLLKKSEDAPLKYYTHREIAQDLAAHMTSRSLLALYDAIDVAQISLSRNASVKLTLTKLCIQAGIFN